MHHRLERQQRLRRVIAQRGIRALRRAKRRDREGYDGLPAVTRPVQTLAPQEQRIVPVTTRRVACCDRLGFDRGLCPERARTSGSGRIRH